MKGKHLLLLLILGAGLAAVWTQFSKKDQAAWAGEAHAGGKIIEFPINEVVQLKIKGGGGELNLVKKEENWTVQERVNFPADYEMVSRVLRKLWDLKSVQEVRVGASQLPRLQLVEPGKDGETGTLVTFLGEGGKDLGSLLLGKSYMRKSDESSEGGFPAGRYIKALDKPRISLVSDTLDEVNTNAQLWLLKEFLGLDSPKSIVVSGANSWSVARESATAEWLLSDIKPEEKMETRKTSSFGNLFGSAPFVDVVALDQKSEIATTAVVETFDGFRCELSIGKEQAGNYPLFVQVSGNFAKERTPAADEKPEDKTRLDEEFAKKLKGLEEKLAKAKKFEAWGYVVSKFRVEGLLQDRASLVTIKPAEAPKTPEEPKPAVTTPPVEASKVPEPTKSAEEPKAAEVPKAPSE